MRTMCVNSAYLKRATYKNIIRYLPYLKVYPHVRIKVFAQGTGVYKIDLFTLD